MTCVHLTALLTGMLIPVSNHGSCEDKNVTKQADAEHHRSSRLVPSTKSLTRF